MTRTPRPPAPPRVTLRLTQAQAAALWHRLNLNDRRFARAYTHAEGEGMADVDLTGVWANLNAALDGLGLLDADGVPR